MSRVEDFGASRSDLQSRAGWNVERLFSRHFHALSDQDIDDLRLISETVLKHRGEIVRDWYRQYVLDLGDSRSLSQHQFFRIFEDALQDRHSALLSGDISEYAAGVSRLGDLLAGQRIPLEEAIASLHLLPNSIGAASGQRSASLTAALDKLTRLEMMLLVSAYFRSEPAAARERDAALEDQASQLPAGGRTRFAGLHGASAAMRQLYQRIEAVAGTAGNVLIAGETGTGKELVARIIHKCGARARRSYVTLNCAALPADLIESELFGYQRTTANGETAEYLGALRAAGGGTLFLDEINRMSAGTQSKLLRAVQEGTLRPLGPTGEQPVEVRIVASTNRDLEAALADGGLAQDFYDSVQTAVLKIVPLRQRREDIPLLVEHFIRTFNHRMGRSVAGIENQALQALVEYGWPGNARELSNAVEAAFTVASGRLLALEDLPPAIVVQTENALALTNDGAREGAPLATFAETERELIARALQSNGGNKVRAASQLKISRKKLYAKIAKYNLAQSKRAAIKQSKRAAIKRSGAREHPA
jgi:DNA-binding NtrC family response regulator